MTLSESMREALKSTADKLYGHARRIFMAQIVRGLGRGGPRQAPYHSKYNPVQRVWSVLENEWNGDLLDTIAAALGHAQAMTWNGNHPAVQFVDKTYQTGKRLGAAAMRVLEKRLQRLPGLEKWFVDIAPRPAPA